MGEAYRQPAQNPHLEHVVELLRQAQTFYFTFDESASTQASREKVALVARLVDPRYGDTKDEDLDATLDQAHSAFWSRINEARSLLSQAGYRVSGLDGQGRPQTLWGSREDRRAAQRALAELQALLPNADFSTKRDAEAEAFIAQQRQRKRLVLYLGLIAVFVLPPVVIALIAIFG